MFSHEVISDSFVTPWTVAHQAPLSVEFPRQEYWSVLLFTSPRDLPDPGIEHVFPVLASRFFTTEPPGKSNYVYHIHIYTHHIHTNIDHMYIFLIFFIYSQFFLVITNMTEVLFT